MFANQQLNILSGSIEMILFALKNSNHEFFLTGSRYFENNINLTSPKDWDFFTSANQQNIESFLKNLGFKANSNSSGYIRACEVCAVYEIPSKKIQVQLVMDIYKKSIIQEKILESIGANKFNSLSKDIRKYIWNLSYECFNKGLHWNNTLLLAS